ncbi:hypothetical protein HID58_081240 [Brassica napus]|uniref:Protein kinase domain-containing protein n=1 Tax=Brassica napus TaxID=3708 RepID=A0ABQ7Y8F7_BRANA|nr:hypothetical protein HID58_081240 [Brassica napus]
MWGSCFSCHKSGGEPSQVDREISAIIKVKIYKYKEIRQATNDFDALNKIGEGGFGSVYKGRLKDGNIAAIKVLSAESRQGVKEFLTEINVISEIQHENLVKLYGCCVERDHRILVYNYLENSSLDMTLLAGGYIKSGIQFDWSTRSRICAWDLYERNELVDLVDTGLNGVFDGDEACRYLKIGLLCTQDNPKLRPSMSTVVKLLTGEKKDIESRNITRPGLISDFMDLKVKGPVEKKPEEVNRRSNYYTNLSSDNASSSTGTRDNSNAYSSGASSSTAFRDLSRFGLVVVVVMAPKSTERALNSRKQQRRLLFLSIARTCKNLRSDHKDRDPQRMPANTYLEQQANVHALAGLKIENSTVEKAPSVSISAGAQYKPCPADDASKAKYMTVARRLEQMLFKMAISKEEYMNPSTLESRIASLIKGKQLNNYNKRRTNSSLVGKMAPTTTGLSHAGASAGLGPSGNTVGPMDHDVLELREYMRTLVFSELHKHHPCPADDASKAKYLHVSRRLEEGIYQMANTKDYLNPSTLTSRLACLIRGKKLNNYVQIQQNANSSSPGTMTTLAPEVFAETTMSGDELETEIAENLKSISLYS